jgi:hypothetical protein
MGMELIGGGLGLLGSIIGGNSAEDAARTSSNAQLDAARVAADAQRFRPVGVTTRFGSSNFTTDAQGNLTGAGYNVSPEVAMMRDRLLSQAGTQGFQTADQAQAAQQQLFGLGQQYLAQSPQEAAQQWMQSQRALLAPSREQAAAGLTQNLFNTGRGGVAVAQGGNMGAANPELQALLNAQAQQDAQLAAEAQAQGRAQTTFGAGLFGTGLDLATTGYNPLKTQFGLAQGFETAGQGALDLGAKLGGRAAESGTNVGNTLFKGSVLAANEMQKADEYNPFGALLSGAGSNKQLMSGLSNWMSPYGGTAQGAYGQQDQYLAGALANPQTQQARLLADQNAWF